MGGKMFQQSTSIQDSADILQRKLQFTKMIEKFARDDTSYAHVVANNIKKINNNQKVEAISVLSSSSNEEIDREHVFSCASCPRKFSSQQAMAGHRNTHRNEWKPIELQDISNHDKMQHRELSCYPELPPFPNPTIDPKHQSFGNDQSTMCITSNTIPMQSLCAPRYPLAKPINILKRSPVYVLQYPLTNRTNTHKGTSTCVPRYCMVKANPTIALNGPTPRYTLAKANYPTLALERPTHGYTSGKANPTIAIKETTPGYPLATANPTIAFKEPIHVEPLTKANPANALKWPSPKYHMVKAITTNTLKRASPRHLLSNHRNILIEPGRPYIFAKPKSSLIGPSCGVSHYDFVPLTNTLNMPSTWEQNNPLGKGATLHGKSTLGVKRESMIHKPCQGKLGRNNTWLRGGSTSLARQQMIRGKIRHLGVNNNNVGLKSLSTYGGSASMSEGRGNSEAHDLFSSSFQPINGKGKKTNAILAPSPMQERHSHDDHSSQGLIMQCDSNGENDSFLDVDLDLKL